MELLLLFKLTSKIEIFNVSNNILVYQYIDSSIKSNPRSAVRSFPFGSFSNVGVWPVRGCFLGKDVSKGFRMAHDHTVNYQNSFQ